ncbi:MAG: flagella basal body P-ring formation protein FlgA [Novosphingobium sp.]|nr:flagella basal body P-ring formation protein FlgA [Novosphingobium sp.]
MPGRDLRLLHEGPQRFAARAAGTGGEDRRAGRECFALRQNLPAGAYVTGEVLVPAACKKDTARPLPLRYDASAGATELARPLSAGTYLGRVAVRAGEIVESGRTLVLSVREGPVRIEREVHALQPSRTGRAIFVRTADGQILAAPLATTGTAESAR